MLCAAVLVVDGSVRVFLMNFSAVLWSCCARSGAFLDEKNGPFCVLCHGCSVCVCVFVIPVCSLQLCVFCRFISSIPPL